MHDQVVAASPADNPLVGRERELAALRAALDAALAGRGALILIGGEAGIGKTALAEWLLAQAAARGALALVGHCYDLSETPPYGPWREVFGRARRAAGMPPLPAAVLPPDQAGAAADSQDAIFRHVLAYLTAAARPLVVLLDDLHWSDPASLDLLRFLGRGLAERPLLLLATYRSDELTRHHPLYRLIPLLVREARPIRLDPQPLDGPATRALIGRYALPATDVGRLGAWLNAWAAGNALFTVQLVRALEDTRTLREGPGGWTLGELQAFGLPASLRQMLDARIDRLGEETRELLAEAALIGQDVDWDLWAAASGRDEETVNRVAERAVEAHLLREVAEKPVLSFVHALVREALYESLTPSRRRALHLRVGEVLAARAAPDPDAVAHHFRRAGDPRAVLWLARAGERAQRAWAYVTAVARFAAAADVAERLQGFGREAGWLHYRAGVLSFSTFDDLSRAVAGLDKAVLAGEQAGDVALTSLARYFRAMIRLHATNFREGVAAGLAEMADAVATFEALPDRLPIRLDTLDDFVAAPSVYDEYNPPGALILYLAQAGHTADALARGTANLAAMPAAATGIARAAYGDSFFGLALAHAVQGRPDEARRAFVQTCESYGAIDHQQQIAVALWSEVTAIWLPYRADRPMERAALVSGAEAAAARASAIYDPAAARFRHLPLLYHDGAWDEIRQLAAAVVASGRPETYVLGQLAREEGEPERAWAMVREHLAEGYDTPPGGGHFARGLLILRLAARLALDAGDLTAAAAWLEAHDRWLAWNGATLGRADGALGWAEFHRAAGDTASARQHAERALAGASNPSQPLVALAARRLLGELDTARGHYADAATHLHAALALAEVCGTPYERALTLLAQAALCAANGEVAAAIAALAEACTTLAVLGAAPALARADTLAAALAAAPAPVPPRATLPFGLTAREAEVLRLVSQGHANLAIAERLSLSHRTVEQHLRSVYHKLGVENRVAAIRLALEHDLA